MTVVLPPLAASPAPAPTDAPGIGVARSDQTDLPDPGRGLRPRLATRRYMHHNRLVALVLLGNVAVAGFGLSAGWWDTPDRSLGIMSTAVLANVALAVLIRQQYVVNALFAIATAAPTHWPLRVRATLAKVYHFGGLHVGGAVAGTGWFLGYVGVSTYAGVTGQAPVTLAVLWLGWLILAIMIAMIATALPRFRVPRHNLFERFHRFAGWGLLALFWLHTAVVAQGPAHFIVLGVLTASVAAPWLRLRRVPVDVVTPSPHVALASFDYGVRPFAGSSTAVSRRPLLEWHHFANVPSPERDGYRLTISRSGDWTASFIAERPTHVWVKGIPTAGVGNIDRLFRRVVWVATGSGIGPTLPHLLTGDTPAHLIWSTRSARTTYGDQLVEEILAVQPGALIWETDQHGKPDLVALAYDAVQATGAEAVICISNKRTTWQVVEGMETRGIPAYGAIWDS